MVVAGDVYINGPMYSKGAVHVRAKTAATTDTGKVFIASTSGAVLKTDEIILHSNDTNEGLLLNDNASGVKGASVTDVVKVTVRKTFTASPTQYTYLSLPFDVAGAGNVRTSAGVALTSKDDFGVWKFDPEIRSGDKGFENPDVWTEVDYDGGDPIAKGMGHLFWYGDGGDVDFITTDPTAIAYLFSTSDKTVQYPLYKNADTSNPSSNPFQEELDAGWAFIGGLGSANFKFGSVGGDAVVAAYHRDAATSSVEPTGQKYNEYTEIVLGEETSKVGPYTPFYIQGDFGTTTTNGDPAYFTFNHAGYVLDGITFRSGNETGRKDQLYFALSSDENNSFDRFYLNFADNYIESYKAAEDAIKMATAFANRPTVWSVQDETNARLVVNGLPMKEGERAVRMGFSVPKAGDYTISLNPLRQQDVKNVILADNITGKKIDLLQYPYSFSTGTVVNENERFVLYINGSYLGIPSIGSDGLYAYVKDNLLTVKNLSEGDRVRVLDLTGRTVASGNASGKEFSVALSQKGVYVVNVKGGKTSVLKVLNK